MAAAPPATGPPAPVASLAYLHKDAGPPEERGCFVVGPQDHALLGGFANVSVAPAGATDLHVPLYYLEAALLSVVSSTSGGLGGQPGQPLGALGVKRLTVSKVTDMADFISDMGLSFNGSAEDTLLTNAPRAVSRLFLFPRLGPTMGGRARGPLLGPCRS